MILDLHALGAFQADDNEAALGSTFKALSRRLPITPVIVARFPVTRHGNEIELLRSPGGKAADARHLPRRSADRCSGWRSDLQRSARATSSAGRQPQKNDAADAEAIAEATS